MTHPSHGISVVVCAYTEKRWSDMLAAVESIQNQSLQPNEIILVVDHNQALFIRARQELKGIKVIENTGERGLSGARNSGIALAHGEIVAFMDEDAVARTDWLEMLERAYGDPQVMGTGGSIRPLWEDSRPDWFPEEFEWVVGCTYLGMPEGTANVRNLIGCNMSFRREVFAEAGGFRSGIGRIGTLPVGCEETEICIRANQKWPGRNFIYEPEAIVDHRVPKDRATYKYFRTRCYSEGISKAIISRFTGTKDGLNSEWNYTLKTLPAGVLRGLKDGFVRGNLSGFQRALAISSGLAFTVLGFLVGKVRELFNPYKVSETNDVFLVEEPARGS